MRTSTPDSFWNVIGEEIDDAQVEVLAAEEGVAVGGEHLELTLAVDGGDLDERDIEGAAAQVIDGDLAIAALLVEPIGQRGRGRLIDDALHFEPGDAPGILGRLALRVVEIGGHGDHGLRDRLAEIVLGRLLHLHEDARGDLRRGHLLALRLDPGIAVVGADDLVRHHLDVALHDFILERRPIRRLTANRVFCGLVTAWRLADWPTSTSSSLVKATMEGVVRSPSLFSITRGLPPSMMATHEFVVPRSMPIVFAMR